MKLLNFLFGFVVIAIANCIDEESKVAELLSSGSSKFTAQMFKEVAKENSNKSFVLSAFSVLTPLAQLSQATEGRSHDELLSAIGLPDDESTKSVFSYMNTELRSVKGVDLKMANKLYIADGLELNDEYKAISRDTFQSDLQNVDFTKSTETAREINEWVENQTNYRIKDLVDPDNLSGDTKAVLVNAIYFKGTWKNQFNKHFTQERDFHVSSAKKVKVPTMYRKGNFNYGVDNDLDAQILEMPYTGDESSLYIILPRKIEGISALEEKLRNSSVLENALSKIHDEEVVVYIPKFKIETSTNLKEILPRIGVKDIFDIEKANLTKLLKAPGKFYISDAIQKAFIEINEEGAEATAANSFGISYLAAYIPQETKFVADHPFIFLLKTNENILFSGAYRS